MDISDKKILLLDRSKQGAGMVKQILQDAGFDKITISSSTVEAMDLLSRNKFDIVSSELILGDTTALSLFEKIRDNHQFDNMGYVLFATNASKGLIAQAVEKNIDAVVSKPFTANSVKAAFEKVIQKRFHPSPFSIKVQEAEKQIVDRRYTEAESFLKEALELDPKPAIVNYHLGRIALVRGAFDESEEFFRKGLNLKKNNLKCLFGMIFCVEKREKLKEAYVYSKRLIRIHPASLKRLSFAMDYSFDNKLFDELYFFIGLASTNEFIDGDFKRKLIKRSYQLADSYMKSDSKKAMVLLSSIRKLAYKDLSVRHKIAEVLIKHNKADLADKELAYCKKNGDQSDELLFLDCKVSFVLKQYYPCVKAAQNLLKNNYDNPEIYLLLAKSYVELNDMERAEKNVSLAVREMPESVEARELYQRVSEANEKAKKNKK